MFNNLQISLHLIFYRLIALIERIYGLDGKIHEIIKDLIEILYNFWVFITENNLHQLRAEKTHWITVLNEKLWIQFHPFWYINHVE